MPHAISSSRRSLLVGEVTAAQLVPQRTALALRLGDDEFLAALSSATPGSPSYVVGHRVDGRAYDEVVLHHGPAGARCTWRRVGEHGDRADYVLVGDTSSRGFATVER